MAVNKISQGMSPQTGLSVVDRYHLSEHSPVMLAGWDSVVPPLLLVTVQRYTPSSPNLTGLKLRLAIVWLIRSVNNKLFIEELLPLPDIGVRCVTLPPLGVSSAFCHWYVMLTLGDAKHSSWAFSPALTKISWGWSMIVGPPECHRNEVALFQTRVNKERKDNFYFKCKIPGT